MAIPEYGVVTYTSQTTTTTIVLTVPTGGYAAGDAVFIAGYDLATQAGSVSVADTRSNTYTINKGGDVSGQVFLAMSILATALLAGDTVTVTLQSSTRQAAIMWGRPGVLNLSLDGSASFLANQGSNVNLVAPATVTMAAAGELVYGIFAPAVTGSGTDTVTANGAWDIVGQVSASFSVNNRALAVLTKRPSDTGSVVPTATHTANSYYPGTVVLKNVTGVGVATLTGSVTYKVLGQQAPAATTDAVLYTCPTATQTVVSTVAVCNRGTSATTFRLRVAVAGAGAANQQYLAYDVPIAASSVQTFTLGITLGATDQIVCQAAAAQVSFQAFGQEGT